MGADPPRENLYKDYTDEQMRLVRCKEQRKAAVVAEYAAQVMLDYPSKVIKDAVQARSLHRISSTCFGGKASLCLHP